MKMTNIFFAVVGIMFLMGCNNVGTNQTDQQNGDVVMMEEDTTRMGDVMTAEEQANLSPDEVLNNLKEGNLRYTQGELTERDLQSQVMKSAIAQHPQAIVLSCVDSRIPVEYVFDQGIGDIFVARVAGNFVNEDILGSMEFACKVSNSKLIMVLGHENCGAVKAAIENVELGNITGMLDNIQPAIEMVNNYEGERSAKNEEFVRLVSEQNVVYNMNKILEQSPVLKEMVDNGEIKIVGGIYEMETGELEVLEEGVSGSL